MIFIPDPLLWLAIGLAWGAYIHIRTTEHKAGSKDDQSV